MIQLTKIFISPHDFLFKKHSVISLSNQHCKSAQKIRCHRAFFWDMPQYMMEVGAGIPWFYPMFVSSIKEVIIRIFVMIIVPNFSKWGKRYMPLWVQKTISFWFSKMLLWNFEMANIVMIWQEIANLIACPKKKWT